MDHRFGRWLSADWSNIPVAIPYANLTNPQTLNLYAMVADDPESFADLDGHAPLDGKPPACGGEFAECHGANRNPEDLTDVEPVFKRGNESAMLRNNAYTNPIGSMLRKGYKWWEFIKKWSGAYYEHDTLQDEMNTDKNIRDMAWRRINNTQNSSHNATAIDLKIFNLAKANILLDGARQGDFFAKIDLGEPDFMKSLADDMFDVYGEMRDAKNKQIDILNGRAAAGLEQWRH